jgi:hypothetical protein
MILSADEDLAASAGRISDMIYFTFACSKTDEINSSSEALEGVLHQLGISIKYRYRRSHIVSTPSVPEML